MTEKERLLAQAAECERLAKGDMSEADRAALLHMARLWRELAETADAEDWRREVGGQLDGTDEID